MFLRRIVLIPRTFTRSISTFQVAAIDYATGKAEQKVYQTDELLKVTELTARDLFALNLTSRQERRPLQRTLAAILPRRQLVVASIGSFRAVVAPTKLYLLDAHLETVKDFAKDLALAYPTSRSNTSVFLECVLRETVEGFQRRLRLFQPIVDTFLNKVHSEVYGDIGSNQSFPIKDALQSFEMEIQQILDCLTNVEMPEEELLLSLYARQLSNLEFEVSLLLKRIQSKQEFVTMALSSYRNRMVKMNVRINIAVLSMGFGTYIPTFFGQNIPNGMETNAFIFNYVVSTSIIGGCAIAAISLSYLSGNYLRYQAAQRLEANEALSSALSDMMALDYTIKAIKNSNKAVSKDKFRQILRKGRQSRQVSPEEVDLLFDVFDKAKDGFIDNEDLSGDVPEKK